MSLSNLMWLLLNNPFGFFVVASIVMAQVVYYSRRPEDEDKKEQVIFDACVRPGQ